MLLFLPGRGFIFIQQQECSMKVNISQEDLFGDSIREMRERDKEFLPKPEWFSRIETDPDTFMQTYMTKYPFTSFEAIPGDESGLTFPAFEDLQFYLPQPLRYQRSTDWPFSVFLVTVHSASTRAGGTGSKPTSQKALLNTRRFQSVTQVWTAAIARCC